MRKYEIDMTHHKPVVIESDDWGACEYTADPQMQKTYLEILKKYGRQDEASYTTLESTADLERLYSLLESHTDCRGRHPVFTSYTCMGNPDFDAIRANGFTEYVDIPIDKGFPSMWQRPGVIEKYLEGEKRGVWRAEYHAMLHHTSPKLWLEKVRDGEFERALFDLQNYYLLYHLPEYDGYNLREQHAMIAEGFNRFKRIFGRLPSCCVTSDAYPETEILWSALGATSIALINCRVNSGETVVYPTKPWNMQNIYGRLGDYNEKEDITYLTRNAFMEWGCTEEQIIAAAKRSWEVYHEPVIISSHRGNYCNFKPGAADAHYERLDRVLTILESLGAEYTTSAELGNAYRFGTEF